METTEVLVVRLEHIKQELIEIKEDGKVTKEQALKTNGRVNHHDDVLGYLQEVVKKYLEERESEQKNIISKYEQKWELIKSTGFKFAIAAVLAIAAANQLPELVVKFIHFFTSLYG